MQTCLLERSHVYCSKTGCSKSQCVQTTKPHWRPSKQLSENDVVDLRVVLWWLQELKVSTTLFRAVARVEQEGCAGWRQMCCGKELQSTDVTGRRIRRVLERISIWSHRKILLCPRIPDEVQWQYLSGSFLYFCCQWNSYCILSVLSWKEKNKNLCQVGFQNTVLYQLSVLLRLSRILSKNEFSLLKSWKCFFGMCYKATLLV